MVDNSAGQPSNQMFSVRDFGAVGDGQTDDTTAIQAAIDAAAKCFGTVYFSPGIYASRTLTLKPHITLSGCATWTYWHYKGSILKLIDPTARCLLDATGAVGVIINGLALDGLGPDGQHLGSGIHGIMVADTLPKQREPWPFEDVARDDTIFIERSLIRNFSGDGLHLDGIWVFTIRHSMIANNLANGIFVHGYDGYVMDCWLSANRKAGYFGANGLNAAITMTANRIEWNNEGGIIIAGGNHYNLTGNYIDRSGGPAIWLRPHDEVACRHFTITGNILHRSGAHARDDDVANSHLVLDRCQGVVVTGNTMSVGQDDGRQGRFTPDYGVIYRQLDHCIVRDNVLYEGAQRELVRSLDGNEETTSIIRDNIGTLAQITRIASE